MKESSSESEDTLVYDIGYNCGKEDQFVPMAAIGIVCAIAGFIIGLAL